MTQDYLKPREAPFTYILVISNILIYLCLELVGNTLDASFMLEHGAMNPVYVVYGREWYRLFSAMFLHFGVTHLANNMLLLFLLGQIFERAVGTTRFAGIYLGSGLAGSFLSLIYMCVMNRNDVVAGASGAIFGIVGGMVVVVLVHKGKYQGITSRRMLFMAAITLYFGFATAGTDNAGHVGGLLAGLILTFLSYGIPILIRNHRG